MRDLSRTFRLLAFGVALAQYVLAGAFAVLDGQLEASANKVVASHIESQTAPCGVKHHSPECGICHFLALRIGAAAEPYVVPEIRVTSRFVEATKPLYVPAPVPDRLLLPRAPPTLTFA
jgi:hypothetical protein